MAIKDIIRNGARFDGDTYSIKYFGISQNITNLKKGKNSISLSPSQFVKPGSSIEIEIFDANRKPIRVIYTNKISANNDFLVNIIVGEDATPGRADAYIKGTATKNPDTGQVVQEGLTVVWYGLIDIKLEDDVITPESEKDLILTEGMENIVVTVMAKDIPYQSGDPRHTTLAGTGTISYFPVIQSAAAAGNIANKPDVLTTTVATSISTVDGNIATSTKGGQVSADDDLPIITSTASEFTADMVNGIITVTPVLNDFVPPLLQGNIGTIPEYEATIVRVINATTIAVDTHFSHRVPGAAGTPLAQGIVVDRFTATVFNIEYNKSNTTTPGQKVTGYAHICFKNTATDNGKINKVKVAVKPVGSIGTPMELGEFDPVAPSKMEDDTTFTYDPITGLTYKPIGQVTSTTDVSTYYDTENYQLKSSPSGNQNTLNYEVVGAAAVNQSSAKLSNALTIAAPTLGQVSAVSVKSAYAGSALAGTEYSIQFNAYSEGNNAELLLYISGPTIENGGDTSNFGTLLATIPGGNGQTQSGLSWTFKTVSAAAAIKPYLVVKSGTWHISGLDIKPSSSTNNSPNELCIDVPLDNLPVNKIGEEYVFVLDFVGEDGKPLNLGLTSQGIPLNENTTIDESLIINTFTSSTLIQNAISGSITATSASFSTTITNLSSSIAGDINSVSSSLASDITILSSSIVNTINNVVNPISGSLIHQASYAGSTLTLTQNDGGTILATIGPFTNYPSWNLRTKPTTAPYTSGHNVTSLSCVHISGSLAIGVGQKAPGNIIQVCHVDTSALSGPYGGSGISSVTVDGFGHVTGVTTAAYCTSIPTIGAGNMTVSSSGALTGCQTFNANQTGASSVNITHKDTSGQPSIGSSTRRYINSVTLDTYGHVTGLGTGTESVVDTNTYVTTGTMLAAPTDKTLQLTGNTGFTAVNITLPPGIHCTGTVTSAVTSVGVTAGLLVSNPASTATVCLNRGGLPAPACDPTNAVNMIAGAASWAIAPTAQCICATQDFLLVNDAFHNNFPAPGQAACNRVKKISVANFLALVPAPPGVQNVAAGTGITVGTPTGPTATVNQATIDGVAGSHGSLLGGSITCLNINSTGHIAAIACHPVSVHSVTVAPGDTWITITSPGFPAPAPYCRVMSHAAAQVESFFVNVCTPSGICCLKFDSKGHYTTTALP